MLIRRSFGSYDCVSTLVFVLSCFGGIHSMGGVLRRFGYQKTGHPFGCRLVRLVSLALFLRHHLFTLHLRFIEHVHNLAAAKKNIITTGIEACGASWSMAYTRDSCTTGIWEPTLTRATPLTRPAGTSALANRGPPLARNSEVVGELSGPSILPVYSGRTVTGRASFMSIRTGTILVCLAASTSSSFPSSSSSLPLSLF